MTRPGPASASANAVPLQSQPAGNRPGARPELETPAAIDPDLRVAPDDLEKLARWVPSKEMALLVELCDRARRDPDLARPALLLCSAYAKRVARMLDQDPCPTVTRQIAERLRQLRTKGGL